MNSQVDDKKKQKTRVKVAIRVRPMIPKQIANNENSCVQFNSNNQIVLGTDRNYKFDHVFKDTSHQSEIYNSCVKQLVLSCFQGYNAAILAYGQTGSGKTFTMGTATHTLGNQNATGIVPRVIHQIFSIIQQRKHKVQFRVKASFLQIYNEEIKDLLIMDHGIKNIKNKDNGISIREEKDGSVSIYGLTEQLSTTPQQMVQLLQRGGYNRTTAATLMNDASSRSHAIFTIFIEQNFIEDLYQSKKPNQVDSSQGYMIAKFFFVDLAGSQRAKKTGATGATLKEGININLGLLQLGNVISALSTIEKKQDQFITYRNSKLTRILQDCLGGNSNTYMIACVSPAQSNFQQSLNTLKYASKAMNIKNKPIVNRDPQSALISQLKQKIFQLQMQNRKMKQIISKQGGSMQGMIQNIDQFNTQLCQIDDNSNQIEQLKSKISQIQKKNDTLTVQAQQNRRKVNQLQIKTYQLRRKNDKYQLMIQQLQKEHPQFHLIKKFQTQQSDEQKNNNQSGKSLLQNYQQQIQKLQSQLQDKDKLFNQMQKQVQKMQRNSKNDQQILIKKNKQIYELTKQITKLQKIFNDTNSFQSRSSVYGLSMIKPQQNSSLMMKKQQESTQLTLNNQQDITQLQDEFMQNDKQIADQRESLQKIQQQASNELFEIEKYIKQKQQYLQQMTKKQINMEYQLISQMKEQYHQKILLLEKQKKFLVKQKDQSLSNNQKTKFVSKIDGLQTQLKDYRKKIRQQKNIQKQLSSQNIQIKQLADQIKKFKLQKLQLNRKLKQDKDNFNKLKNQRIKQLLNAKKQNLKKQNALKKAQLENKKKNLIVKKKDQQIKRFKRVNQTLKTLARQPNLTASTSIKQSTTGKKQATTVTTNIHKKSFNTSNNAQLLRSSNNGNQLLSQTKSNDIIRQILRKLTTQIDHQNTQKKYTLKIRSLQQQLDILLTDQATFKLRHQKINLMAKQQRTQQQNAQLSQLQITLTQINQRLINLDESINFIRQKQLEIINQHINYFEVDSQVVYNGMLVQLVDNVRTFYKSIFWAIKNLLSDNLVLIQTRQQNQNQINQLRNNVEELRQNIIQLNNEHQNKLSKLRQEMILRSYNNSYSGIQQQQYTPGVVTRKIQEKEKKSLQRKILDLEKNNSRLSKQVQMWKRKCSLVQQKYQYMKNLTSKDKNIGRQQLSEKMSEKQQSKEKRLNKNQSMLDEVNDLLDQFDHIDKIKKAHSVIEDHQRQHEQKQAQISDFSKNKWQCMGKIDAHNSSILSMAAHANILVSTGTKSLKIWDLQTSKIISDLSGPHLAGFVKYVMVDPQRRLMFTACQKNITIWDLITLNVQGTLKAHKDEVRTMHINNDLLFTGGKGLANSGSLLVWDLRNLNPNHPMEQKQKNQDIFTFASKNNTLYYGTRNHHVRRMNMTNMQILSPFQPPHMDSVTSLAIVKDKLISGSKDKNLRLWNLDHSINNAKHTFPAFNDYITVCQSDKQLPIFYAGSRDGQIKVGGIKNDKIQLIGGILAHSQSVNAICPLQQNGNIIVTASADKTIKLWQPTQQTVQGLNSQFI